MKEGKLESIEEIAVKIRKAVQPMLAEDQK